VRAFAYTNQADAAPSGSLKLSATEVFDAQNRNLQNLNIKNEGENKNAGSWPVRVCLEIQAATFRLIY
jgi:hypothetical protein